MKSELIEEVTAHVLQLFCTFAAETSAGTLAKDHHFLSEEFIDVTFLEDTTLVQKLSSFPSTRQPKTSKGYPEGIFTTLDYSLPKLLPRISLL
eukprot:scaffold3515_cov126-Cylindrotheca_fusiformis.AAC.1